jgi:hypothetical protein
MATTAASQWEALRPSVVTFWAKHPDHNVLVASTTLLIDVEQAVLASVYAVQIDRIDVVDSSGEGLRALMAQLHPVSAPKTEAERVVLGNAASSDAAWQAVEDARVAAYESIGALRETLQDAVRHR